MSEINRAVKGTGDVLPADSGNLYNPYTLYNITADNYRLWEDVAAPDTAQNTYTINKYQNHQSHEKNHHLSDARCNRSDSVGSRKCNVQLCP